MTEYERTEICKTCQKRSLHKDLGIVCSLSYQKADFEQMCPNYLPDSVAIEREKKASYSIKDERIQDIIGIIGLVALAVFGLILWGINSLSAGNIGWLILFILIIMLEITRYIWIQHRKLTPTKLDKAICKYLYNNGYHYRKDEGTIIFTYKEVEYSIEIWQYNKHCLVQLACDIGVSEYEHQLDDADKLYCANRMNLWFRFIKTRAYSKGVTLDTYFEVDNPRAFKKDLPTQLKALKGAFTYFQDTCNGLIEYNKSNYVKQERPRIGFHKEA